MLYLSLSLLFSTTIFLIFKLFEKQKVRNLDAIIINYLTAFATGMFFISDYSPEKIIGESWFPFAVIIGLLFISLFNVMAYTAQNMGISVASVANKMAVVIPVIFAFIVYHEEITFLKVSGILSALAGVYMVSKRSHIKIEKKMLYLPLILFIGSGILDTLIKYTQQFHLPENKDLYFIPTLFFLAGFLGICFKFIIKRQFTFRWKDVLWGIILGVPNYFSIYFLVKTLQLPNWESSVIFPINNLGIVSLSFLVALLLFNEKYSKLNWLGFALSLLGITLLAF